MGGFTASNLISKQVGSSGLVTVVEPRLRIPFAPAFQWLVFGWRQPEKIQRSPTGLSKRKNVRMVGDKVEKIDVSGRTVKTKSQTIRYDKLVISLGTEFDFDQVQGLDACSHNAYSIEGALKLREAIDNFDNGSELKYDILITTPPHRSSQVVRDAGLTDDSGWIPVNPYNLATRHEDVFAIGDITSIETPHGHAPYLPKAGVFAQGQAEVVANNLAVSLTKKGEMKQWGGEGSCYLQVAKSESAFLKGAFLSNPPRLEFHPPRRKWFLEKLRLEKEWLNLK